MKEVNRYTSSEFHDWQRRVLPRGLVIQDLDAWTLNISEPETYKPMALIEVKRSSKPVDEWMPYPQDRGNYASLNELAKAAGIDLYVIYHVKGQEILDDTRLTVFRFTEVIPEYHGSKRIRPARVIAAVFPHLHALWGEQRGDSEEVYDRLWAESAQ